ncbi:MAG: type III ribulose-bisphosphate carboxylase [Candidatus Aenigmatarchaeota archaeon]|nr:type III ribulose-bisphosphate carboxylase [Candidatus Aenigmarchaeota archaeon]
MVNPTYLKYVNLKYKPKYSDLIVSAYLEPANNIDFKEAAGAVAAESSVGSWTEVKTTKPEIWKMSAKVFEISGNWIKIAYPIELFESGNMAQIFSSICGNIFGMKEIKNLRIEDVHWPEKIMKSFKGPLFGIPGVRRITRVKDRPLCGTIIKPKIGLNHKEHAKVAYTAWIGGIDIVKDDENLTSQTFNKFEKRVRETLKLKWKAEKETGEKKIYLPNITAETKEMIKRMNFVKEIGGEAVMIDVITVGWSGLQTVREENENLKLILHGHRAMHAAFTRNKRHGISMHVIADACRLIGIDQLHIGTAVGKMEGSKEEIISLGEEIEKSIIKPHGHILAEEWGKIKPVFAVCSGGLHPLHVPELIKMLGKDIIIQAGAGIHGHPGGTLVGAKAMRQAIEATIQGIELKEYAKTHKELKAAIEKWG